MAKEKSQAEFLAEEIKKAISKAKRESADVESPESLLAVEGEIRQSLLDIQKDALQKLKAGDERHDQIEKLLASENERLATLSSDFKKNDDFEKRIRTNIATSRAASERAAAETDDFSQKTATLSAKDLQVKGDSGLTRLIQNYAEEMASAITQMRALGLPAKKFTKNTLDILGGFKRSIDLDAALNVKSDAAKTAKKEISSVLNEHVRNVTEAGTLSPLALLGKNLAGGLKEKVASTIKAIPGMGAMDTMAGLMGFRPISERIDETITGKSDITREGDAGIADIKSEAAMGAAQRQEEYSWSGLNTDTVARSQEEGDAARVAAGVIAENIRGEGAGTRPRPTDDADKSEWGNFPFAGMDRKLAEVRGGEDSPVSRGTGMGGDGVLGTLKSIENILESTLGVAKAAERREVEEAQDSAEPKTESEKHRGSIEDDAAQFLGLGAEDVAEEGGNIIVSGLRYVGRGLISLGAMLLPVAGIIGGMITMGAAVVATALKAYETGQKYRDEAKERLSEEAAEEMGVDTVDQDTGEALTQDELAIASAKKLISDQEKNQTPEFQEAMKAADLTGNTMFGFGAPKLDPEAGPTAEQSYDLLGQLSKQRGQDDAEARYLALRKKETRRDDYELTPTEKRTARGGYATELNMKYGTVAMGAASGTGAVGSNRSVSTISPSGDSPAPPGDAVGGAGPGADNLNIKPNKVGGVQEATGGGKVQPGVREFASLVQGNVVGFNRFTGLDDMWHRANKPNSLHTKGLAMDFTVGKPSDAPAAVRVVKDLADDRGVTMKIFDEYKDKSKDATGGHIHAEFASADEASKMLPGLGGPEYGGRSASAATPTLSSSWPATSRSGAGVAAATASHASQTAAAPTIIANIGGPPAPAAPSVTNMMPIPIPINARTEDMALRALHSANYV